MKLLWLGDFYYDYDYISQDIEIISKWIKENNYYTILNLEGTIDSKKYGKIKKRGPNLSCSFESLNVLKKLNVIGVTLANNHVMDYGSEGLEHTIDLLDKNNILHSGAGRNIEEASKPFIINDGAESIAVYSYGWNIEETVIATESTAGCAPRDKEYIINQIKDNQYNLQKKVVCLHMGFEYNRLPMPYDIDLCHSLVENGVDMIIGNHPHCIQPKEIYKNCNIYYALGNFYFSSRRKRFNKKFRESIHNQCDYGVMVKTNFSLKECEEIIIEYNHDMNETIFSSQKHSLLLKELEGNSWQSKKYIKKAKKCKLNSNPILTCNENLNLRKINRFFLKFKLKELIKKVLKKNKKVDDTSKIKIAYISKNFRINGITNVIMNYALNLNKNKFEIYVLASRPICDEYIKKLLDNNIKFIEVPPKIGIKSFKYYFKLYSILNKKNFDIVHIHGNSATIVIELIIAKIKGIKVRIAHSHNTKCNNYRIHKILKPLISKFCSYCFACSNEAGKWMFDNEFDILPNGFETDKFLFSKENRKKVRKELGLTDEKKLIGHVGIFSEQKNHMFILNVFEKIASLDKDIYLILVGDGSNHDKIYSFINNSVYKDRIICYGETTDVKRLYDAMDIFFFPSKFEGLGIVLLEAQINGLNCVISNKIPEQVVLSDKNVIIKSLDDSCEEWGNSILNNFTDVRSRLAYYNENIESIENYDIKSNIKKIEKIYLSLYKG